jgi:hypothetical protein
MLSDDFSPMLSLRLIIDERPCRIETFVSFQYNAEGSLLVGFDSFSLNL